MGKKKEYLALAVSLAMITALPAQAAPTGPGAPPEPEKYSAEKWARLQDNRIEYDELADLVHEYNPDMSKAWDSYLTMKDDYLNMVTELESQYRHVEETTDQVVAATKFLNDPAIAAQAAQVKMLDKSYRTTVQAMRDTVNKWDTNPKATSALHRAERQITAGAQSAMIGYETIRQNIATLETMVKLYERQVELAGRQAVLGLATENSLTSANASLLAAQVQLNSLRDQQESVRRTLCMLLGYEPDSNPEICSVPKFDMARLSEMNLEEDTKKAIGNNQTLISQRTSAKGTTSDQIAARSRMIAEGDQKLTIEMQRLYQDVLDKKAAYDAACTGFTAAQMSRDASERQYNLGLLSEVQYIGTQISYCQKKAEKESADLNLLQAMETYDWAVLGFATVSD